MQGTCAPKGLAFACAGGTKSAVLAKGLRGDLEIITMTNFCNKALVCPLIGSFYVAEVSFFSGQYDASHVLLNNIFGNDLSVQHSDNPIAKFGTVLRVSYHQYCCSFLVEVY